MCHAFRLRSLVATFASFFAARLLREVRPLLHSMSRPLVARRQRGGRTSTLRATNGAPRGQDAIAALRVSSSRVSGLLELA